MSVRLVILGLLRERPLHGYELKQIIEEHMGDWTAIAFGSIYYALDKLAEEGCVERIATEQEGHRPSRHIYQITERGEEEFLHLLRELWRTPERQYYDFDVALFFITALPHEEVLATLRGRVAGLEAALAHLEAHQNEQTEAPEVPPIAHAIFNHSRVHLRAELMWTQDLLHHVAEGRYP
ncbi:MAG: PadR family transcriptional regulator [Anaerolineae bacterium]|nr:PadR family transcriptional regulator [Anaerolineae bacterium]